MNQKPNNLIQRYIYAVTSKVPHAQRQDIAQELQSLIDDMVRDRAEEDNPAASVLYELGNPSKLADTYRGYARYLIGPRWYDLYILVLKIVLFAVSLAMVIATSIGYLVNSGSADLSSFLQIPAAVVSAMVQAAVWVTVTFFILERVNQKRGKEDEDDWKLDDLPEVPDRSSVIPRSEPLVSLVFLVLFAVIVSVSPKIAEALSQHPNVVMANPFVPAVFQRVIPWFLLILGLDMCIELAKLIIGVQSQKLSMICIPIHVATAALSLYIVLYSGIWNPSFITDLVKSMQLSGASLQFMQRLWSLLPNLLALLIVISFIIEVVQTIRRTLVPCTK
jgi:hypothetical protein